MFLVRQMADLAHLTLIEGNLIGVAVTGTEALGNGGGIQTGENTRVLDNVISGSVGAGIDVGGPNVIQGNFIGTDITGTRALGNGGSGIFMPEGQSTIGGVAEGEGNVISANAGAGILMSSQLTGHNVIQGNRIGTDITGTKALGNGADGIFDIDEFGNMIGGSEPGAGNIISSNTGNGIFLADVDANENLIQGNRIGTDPTGTLPLGNGGNGILLETSVNTIGGLGDATNIIAYNGVAGISVEGAEPVGTRNAIIANSIHDNGKLGIDLGGDGVTPNTP